MCDETKVVFDQFVACLQIALLNEEKQSLLLGMREWKGKRTAADRNAKDTEGGTEKKRGSRKKHMNSPFHIRYGGEHDSLQEREENAGIDRLYSCFGT